MHRLAVLASHEGTTLQAVMDACAAGELNAEVVLVISNNSKSGALRRAREAGIEAVHISGKTHPHAEGNAILDSLQNAQAEWLLLLGYMKRLDPIVLNKFDNKTINTHPSLLPKYGGAGFFGASVHEAVIESGDLETGVTVHYVSEEYDKGEIILQERLHVLPSDDPAALEKRVKSIERLALVEVLKSLCLPRAI